MSSNPYKIEFEQQRTINLNNANKQTFSLYIRAPDSVLAGRFVQKGRWIRKENFGGAFHDVMFVTYN